MVLVHKCLPWIYARLFLERNLDSVCCQKRWRDDLEDTTSISCCFVGKLRERICTANFTLAGKTVIAWVLGIQRFKKLFNMATTQIMQKSFRDDLGFPWVCPKSFQEICVSFDIKVWAFSPRNKVIQWIHAVRQQQECAILRIISHHNSKMCFLW